MYFSIIVRLRSLALQMCWPRSVVSGKNSTLKNLLVVDKPRSFAIRFYRSVRAHGNLIQYIIINYVDVWLSHANLWVWSLLFIVFWAFFENFLFLLDFGLNCSIWFPEVWCVAITIYTQPWRQNIQSYCIIRTMQFWHTSTVLIAGFPTQILDIPLILH